MTATQAVLLDLGSKATTATRVQTFINSLGVVTHFEFFPAYQNVPIASMMTYLGVFNIRDRWPDNTQPGFNQYANAATVGVKFCFNGFPGPGGTETMATAFTAIDTLAATFPNCVGFIEGPNEVNNFAFSYVTTAVTTGASGTTLNFTTTPLPVQKVAQGGWGAGVVVTTNSGTIPANTTIVSATTTTVVLSASTSGIVNGNTITFTMPGSGQPSTNPAVQAAAIAQQTDIYTAAKADTHTSSAPVAYFTDFVPGHTDADWFVSGISDVYNGHPYSTGGNQPMWFFQASPNGGQVQVSSTFPQIPVVNTETGYTTANTPSGNNWSAVDLNVQAIYLLDTYFDSWYCGYTKCYIYELVDEDWSDTNPTDVGGHWGIFHAINYDSAGYSAKPAATAIHNLTTILTDISGTALTFTPGIVSYSITGLLPQTVLPNVTNAGGYSLLFQKSNGFYYIVVWQEFQAWNEAGRTENTITPITVTVNLGRSFANVNVYDPIAGTSAINASTNVSSAVLSLGTHPLIVEFK